MNITFAEWFDVKKLALDGEVDIKGLSVSELKKGLNVEKEHSGKMGSQQLAKNPLKSNLFFLKSIE